MICMRPLLPSPLPLWFSSLLASALFIGSSARADVDCGLFLHASAVALGDPALDVDVGLAASLLSLMEQGASQSSVSSPDHGDIGFTRPLVFSQAAT